MYDTIDDPYTYEHSTVLVNKLDLREQAELDAFEAEISSARADEPLPEGNLDFVHYKAIHHHLFQDVYEWAGKPRTVRQPVLLSREHRRSGDKAVREASGGQLPARAR